VLEDITQQLAYHPVAAKDKTVEVRLWKGIPGKSAVYSFYRCKLYFVKKSDNKSAAQSAHRGEKRITTCGYVDSKYV